ncbi:MAG TPA: DNA polymerase [Terriglobales bacterium]|nr:DNA polymerase [Terriglobales bacterium]
MPRPPLAALDSGPAVNWLLMDLNAYFASAEQQARPELRGKPVAVAALDTPNTVCIAASYEARPFGVKTGVKLSEARRLCPELVLVEARPKVYVEYHHRILEALERCVPVSQVLSIDEAACRLTGLERWLPNALAIAQAIKQELRGVGEVLRCSIGLAPSRYLAKVASDMQKPDGLTVLLAADLPQALFKLELRDLPGVGARTEERLHEKGVRTVEQLCGYDRDGLRKLWGGVWGERMWHWLRGADFDMPESGRKSLSRQHVLAPEHRSRGAAFPVVQKLLHSAAAELRRLDLWAGDIAVNVKFLGGRKEWHAHKRVAACRDSFQMQSILAELWQACPEAKPLLVAVALSDLTADADAPPGLFAAPGSERATRANAVMDDLNRRFGAQTLLPASLQSVRNAARPAIGFRRTPELEDLD